MTASLDSETLARKVRDGFMGFRPQLEKWLPLAIDLHARFESLKTQKTSKTILGCSTWKQFCSDVLGYSQRHMRRLMKEDGLNPAAKYRNKTKPDEETKALAAPAAPSVRDAEWTDDDYIKTCVDFIISALRPLELDPQRFLRVANAIAQEVTGAFLSDDGHDSERSS
ncbi:MAG: hypothetical protein WB630_15990 [Candidatus Acidiferrales bacterium]